MQQSTGVTSQKKATQPVEAPSASTATQPVKAPGALITTQLVESPSVTTGMQPTGQDTAFAADKPEVQPPDITGQSAPVMKNRATSLTGTGTDDRQFSDNASLAYIDEEGEVSDLESAGPDREELVDVDQELSAELTYRETVCGVTSFMGWSLVP